MPHHPFFSRSISALSAVLVILAISALINGGHVLMDSPYPPLIAHAAGGNECSDGEDNDSDGQIDFADFGCFGPNGQETMTDYGFTLFTPTADTKIYYVSKSDGDNANDGLSPQTPFKTLDGFWRFVGDANSTYWILLKRGDTWDTNGEDVIRNWNGGQTHEFGIIGSGKSASNPTLLGSYGASTVRPKLLNTQIVECCGHDHLAFVGLHLEMTDSSTPANSAFFFSAGVDNALIEDNYIRGFSDNLNINDYQDSSPGLIKNFKLRNNIIVDAFSSSGSHSQGIYMQKVRGALIEGNVFDHNGWNESVSGAEATIFNHNMYIQSDTSGVVVRNNISARAASHGLQLRPGGVVEDNYFLDNALAGFTAGGDAGISKSIVTQNVIEGGRDINGETRGFGFELLARSADFTNNIMVNKTCDQGRYGPPLGVSQSASSQTFTITNNVVSSWCPGISLYDLSGSTVLFSRNIINGGDEKSVLYTKASFAGMTFSGNQYQTTNSLSDNTYNNHWFRQDGGEPAYISAEQWPSISGETNATFNTLSFPDGTRSIETYMSSLGKSASKSAFYSEIRKQSKFNWRPEYTAHAINEYFRAGYGLPSVPSTYQTQAPIKTQPVSTPTCTSFTYSAWSTCGSNNKQTRTVQSSSPTNCTGGSPVLSQSCTYTAPVSTPVTCTSFTYSEWSSCKKSSNTKTRTVLSSLPANCTGGSPVTSQSCTYTPTVPKASTPVSAPTTNPLSTYTAPAFVPTQVQSTPSEASNPAAEIQSTPSFLPAREALPEPLTDIECTDGLDNDYDGLIDYPADPDCLSDIDDHEILDLWEAFKRMLRSIGRFLKELVS